MCEPKTSDEQDAIDLTDYEVPVKRSKRVAEKSARQSQKTIEIGVEVDSPEPPAPAVIIKQPPCISEPSTSSSFVQFRTKEAEARSTNFELLHENVWLSPNDSNDRNQARSICDICDCKLSKNELKEGERSCLSNECINRQLQYECNLNCRLGENCDNQNFKQRNYAKCSVFETEKKNLGIRADEVIPAGTFLMEYTGAIINIHEFEARVKEYQESNINHFYFMGLSKKLFIDSTKKGNMSRFLNNSCDPNAVTELWIVDDEQRYGFFSIREIKCGEEITIDYQYQSYGNIADKCYCESTNCRGLISANLDEVEEFTEDVQNQDDTDQEDPVSQEDDIPQLQEPHIESSRIAETNDENIFKIVEACAIRVKRVPLKKTLKRNEKYQHRLQQLAAKNILRPSLLHSSLIAQNQDDRLIPAKWNEKYHHRLPQLAAKNILRPSLLHSKYEAIMLMLEDSTYKENLLPLPDYLEFEDLPTYAKNYIMCKNSMVSITRDNYLQFNPNTQVVNWSLEYFQDLYERNEFPKHKGSFIHFLQIYEFEMHSIETCSSLPLRFNFKLDEKITLRIARYGKEPNGHFVCFAVQKVDNKIMLYIADSQNLNGDKCKVPTAFGIFANNLSNKYKLGVLVEYLECYLQSTDDCGPQSFNNLITFADQINSRDHNMRSVNLKSKPFNVLAARKKFQQTILQHHHEQFIISGIALDFVVDPKPPGSPIKEGEIIDLTEFSSTPMIEPNNEMEKLIEAKKTPMSPKTTQSQPTRASRRANRGKRLTENYTLPQ